MFAAEPLAAADRDRPVPLRLDRVADVRRWRSMRAAVAEAVERRSALERVLIVDVRLQSLRQPAAQLDLQRVVVAEGAAVGHVDVVHVAG